MSANMSANMGANMGANNSAAYAANTVNAAGNSGAPSPMNMSNPSPSPILGQGPGPVPRSPALTPVHMPVPMQPTQQYPANMGQYVAVQSGGPIPQSYQGQRQMYVPMASAVAPANITTGAPGAVGPQPTIPAAPTGTNFIPQSTPMYQQQTPHSIPQHTLPGMVPMSYVPGSSSQPQQGPQTGSSIPQYSNNPSGSGPIYSSYQITQQQGQPGAQGRVPQGNVLVYTNNQVAPHMISQRPASAGAGSVAPITASQPPLLSPSQSMTPAQQLAAMPGQYYQLVQQQGQSHIQAQSQLQQSHHHQYPLQSLPLQLQQQPQGQPVQGQPVQGQPAQGQPVQGQQPTTGTIHFVLPNWDKAEVERRFEENTKLLNDWSNLLTRTGL
jgi:hypothetical protein